MEGSAILTLSSRRRGLRVGVGKIRKVPPVFLWALINKGEKFCYQWTKQIKKQTKNKKQKRVAVKSMKIKEKRTKTDIMSYQ